MKSISSTSDCKRPSHNSRAVEERPAATRAAPYRRASNACRDCWGARPAMRTRRRLSLLANTAMGSGWGGTLRKPNERPWKPPSEARPKSPLIGLFRVIAGRIIGVLTRPVTPEVAGSSPVAPVKDLQIGIFCCLTRRKRPPASIHPAHIPHGNRRTKPAEAANSRRCLPGPCDRRSIERSEKPQA